MTDEKHNGWTNWDTWNANVWLTNADEGIYKRGLDIATLELGLETKSVLMSRLYKKYCNDRPRADAAKVNWDEIVVNFT